MDALSSHLSGMNHCRETTHRYVRWVVFCGSVREGIGKAGLALDRLLRACLLRALLL
jgi:hypothetical protein